MAAETIIESFCERCGTRYTFEPVRKRESKLVGLGKSLGILLDDQPASGASRDPFHGTFHFCLECRQYTCPTCWNEEAGFCVGCMPLPDAPDTASFDAAEAAATMEAASYMDLSLAEHAALGNPDAWPDADLHRRRMEALDLGATIGAIDAATDAADAPLPEDDSWSLTFEPRMPVADAPTRLDADGAEDDDGALGMAAAAIVAVGVSEDPTEDAWMTAVDSEADPGAEAIADAELIAEAGLGAKAVAAAEAEPVAEAELVVEAVADAEPVTEAEPVAELVADAESVAELVADADTEATIAELVAADDTEATIAELVAADDTEATIAELVAADDTEATIASVVEADAPDAGTTADAEATHELLVATLAVAAVGATSHDPDEEADWAHLLGQLPADDEVVPDDWAAMAPALGPDVAPTPVPASIPAAPPAQPPIAPPAATAVPWQLTAPAADAEPRSTAWPPLGPVFRPAPTTAAAPTAPHPSVMAQRAAPQGVLARGQQGGAAQLPKGVRPCVSCELPLSASARFCRRCGRPQG